MSSTEDPNAAPHGRPPIDPAAPPAPPPHAAPPAPHANAPSSPHEPPAAHDARTAYPDAAVPPAFPTSAVPGDYTSRAPGPEMAYTTPSAFAGPPHQGGAAPALAITALVVGIIAFLTGWVPFLGLALGLVGVVLGLIAVRRAHGRALAVIGLIAAGLAVLAGIGVLAVLSFVSSDFWLPDQL